MKYNETDKVELKRELTEEVKKQIVAFLNTTGGRIYIGVEDDGKLNPYTDNDSRDLVDTKVGNWISDAIYPVPYGLVHHSFNDDNVLEIIIGQGTHKPYYLREKGPKPSGVYKRVGRSIRMANEDEILRMVMESKRFVYEEDISDDQNLTFRYFTSEFSRNGYEVDERIFTTLGIKNKEGMFTNLGYLMSDESEITVKFAEYDNNLNFLIKKSFSGSLLKILNDVEEQAEKLNIVSAVIDGKTFKRHETVSYPGASIREIVLNAFCHCDYFIRSNIKIEFFPDRLKVTSPGGIFNATLEEIMKGVQTYRNPKLVNIFDKLGMIENFGTGIPRTIAAYKGTGQEPVFEATDNYFIVTLPNLNAAKTDQINDQISDQINDQISDLGLEILKVVQNHPGIKVPEIYSVLSMNNKDLTVDMIRNKIKRELKQYIIHVGSKKDGGYYIKNNLLTKK